MKVQEEKTPGHKNGISGLGGNLTFPLDMVHHLPKKSLSLAEKIKERNIPLVMSTFSFSGIEGGGERT